MFAGGITGVSGTLANMLDAQDFMLHTKEQKRLLG
jgi:hypothetical protein